MTKISCIIFFVLFVLFHSARAGNMRSEPRQGVAPNSAVIEQSSTSGKYAITAAWIAGGCTVCAALISIIPIIRYRKSLSRKSNGTT